MMYYDFSEILVILIVNILRIALLKKVFEHFLSAKVLPQGFVKAAFCICYFITTAAYVVFRVSHPFYLCSLACILGVSVLYRASWGKRLWISLSCLCMDMGCGLMVFFTFSDEGWIQQPAIQTLLLLVCVLLISRIPSSEESREILLQKKQMLVLLLIPGLSLLSDVCLLMNKKNRFSAVFLCAVLVILNLCIFYLYHRLAENSVRLREQEIYKQQTFAYQNQLEVIVESQSRIRALKHDMQNHMLTIRTLAKNAQQEELLEYLSSMQEFMKNPSEYVYTGNEALDSLLNYKIQKAQEELKQIETDIVIPERLELRSFDLSVVLGNLLDNAIAAAVQTEEQLLRLKMRMEKGILFLYMVNSCTGIPKGVCDMEKMVKKSACGHGIGLANVRRIVEKYHGEIEMRCEEQHMITEVLLYLKEV